MTPQDIKKEQYKVKKNKRKCTFIGKTTDLETDLRWYHLRVIGLPESHEQKRP